MIKKLRKKFVFLTMSISIVVLLIIAISINIANYYSVMNKSDEVLNLLVAGDLQTGESFNNREKFSKEIAFTTRFFTVRSNEYDEIDFIDTKNISSISPEVALEYASIVNENEETSGTIGNFRYIKTENPIGYSYFFLDIEEDLMGLKAYMYYSIIIVFWAIVLIFILSIILSKKAVSPIIKSYERQKEFITNASHEIKTPLAIIRADCDVLEIENGDSEWTNSIKMQISRLDDLVENLISLSELDEKIIAVKKDFILTDAVRETLNEFSASIKNAELNLLECIEDNISYKGDEVFIKKLISILIENAVKYSIAKTDIKVLLKSNGNKKILRIENFCEPIEVGSHNDWFERFSRGDKSRNSEIKGFGIGLSMAKTICDLHNAKISADSKTGKELIVTVIL